MVCSLRGIPGPSGEPTKEFPYCRRMSCAVCCKSSRPKRGMLLGVITSIQAVAALQWTGEMARLPGLDWGSGGIWIILNKLLSYVVFWGRAGAARGEGLSRGQAPEKAQNGNAEVLSKVDMDLGLARVRHVGLGSTGPCYSQREKSHQQILDFQKDSRSNDLVSRKTVHSAMVASIASPIVTRTLTAVVGSDPVRQLHILYMILIPMILFSPERRPENEKWPEGSA